MAQHRISAWTPSWLPLNGCPRCRASRAADAHTAAFDIDEDCLMVGVKALAAVVADFLNQHAGQQ